MKEEREGLGGLTRREFLYLTGLGTSGMTLAGFPQLGRGEEKKPKYGGLISRHVRSTMTRLIALEIDRFLR